MNPIKYPKITVQLSDRDGNAFSVIGAVTKALKNANVAKERIDEFCDEAMSGDYDHLLQTCMQWVNVE